MQLFYIHLVSMICVVCLSIACPASVLDCIRRLHACDHTHTRTHTQSRRMRKHTQFWLENVWANTHSANVCRAAPHSSRAYSDSAQTLSHMGDTGIAVECSLSGGGRGSHGH